MTEPTPGRSRRGPPRALRPGSEPHRCAWPDCTDEAHYPAPRTRDRLRDFQWFCLEHIREFNRRWDFFRGMGREQIEAHARADVTWHRPSWRLGGRATEERIWRDVFGLFGDERCQSPPPSPPRPRSKAEEMMAVLELDGGFTLAELKSRYKALAKQHHPDLNGGDKNAEERLKLINQAYTFLREQRLYADV